MGKASRGKRAQESVGLQIREGVDWAAQLICHPQVASTSLRHKMMSSFKEGGPSPSVPPVEDAPQAQDQEDRTPAQWAGTFLAAFDNAKFVVLLQAIIEEGQKAFRKQRDPVEAFVFGDNRRPPADDPMRLALERGHRKLTADPQGPAWIALALFCLTRAVAVNARTGFESNQWTDATLLWFDLDRCTFEGDGKQISALFVKVDRDLVRGKLAQLVGPRMMHGLAEAAINAGDTALFL